MTLSDEIKYQLLKELEANPNASQRELAQSLGVSLGKTNYCLKALLEKGWLKAGNFKRNPNKLKYAYILTPAGLEEKAAVTRRFLKRKLREHERIQQDIEDLKAEVAANQNATIGNQ